MKKSDGREFESKVYDCILKTLESNSYVEAENIFFHKKYFSKDRNDYIETDITVEIKIQNILFLIVVIECKDYKTSLDVSEIEEFHSKLQQIGSDNTKGIIVTSNGKFRKAAINYSKSKGISLARLYNEDIRYDSIMAIKINDCMVEGANNIIIDNNYIEIERRIELLEELKQSGIISQNDIESMIKTILDVKNKPMNNIKEGKLENKVENLEMNNTCERLISQKTDSKNDEEIEANEKVEEINIQFEDIFNQLSHFLEKLQFTLNNELPYIVFVQFCKSIIGSPCVYGVNGEVLTIELLEELKGKFPDIYTDDYVLKAYKYLGEICYDKDFINLITKHHSAHSIYNSYVRIPFKNLSENNIGWLLENPFSNRHAVYIGDGYCVEAGGIDQGVVKSSVYDSHWWRVCKIEGINYNLDDDKYDVNYLLNKIQLLGIK